jgi:hypothetical protein
MAHQKKLKLEQTARQVIEDRLLTSLESGHQVAVLCGKEELGQLVRGLHRFPGTWKDRDFAKSLIQLGEAVFGKDFYQL